MGVGSGSTVDRLFVSRFRRPFPSGNATLISSFPLPTAHSPLPSNFGFDNIPPSGRSLRACSNGCIWPAATSGKRDSREGRCDRARQQCPLPQGTDPAAQVLAKSGHSLKSLLPEAFALGIEASRRVLGKKHYPVQIMGGIAMIDGNIIEMQTGEGKTLTAVLPAMLRALPGRGCHVLTANEYLAKRDAEEMGRSFESWGFPLAAFTKRWKTQSAFPNTSATSLTAQPLRSVSTSCVTGSNAGRPE